MDSVRENIKHPCFNEGVCKEWGRVHLPVAPECNIQCNFCNRLYDCVNESRPGVTSRILTPEEACDKFIEIKKKIKNISIVGFAGPGDPLANFDKVKRTIELIREVDKDVEFCLSTNGLLLPQLAYEIIAMGISYITVTINTLDERIGADIYEYITFQGEPLTQDTAAEVLITKQLEGLEILCKAGVICKVNTLYLQGLNDRQIEEIAQKVAELGAYMMNIKNFVPVEGSRFENLTRAGMEEINEMRKKCSKYIKQMYHCQQCRADAVGLLTNDRFKEFF